MLLRAFMVWCILVVFAVLNGMFREAVIAPAWGDPYGHIISTVIFCAVIFSAALISIRWMRPADRSHALQIGLLWVVLTVAFEFLAGHYMFGNSWDSLMADYNIASGRVWIFVLITCYFAPRWALLIRK